jgi:hypothetical protein
MHYTEGWALFAVAFILVGAVAWVFTHAEHLYYGRRAVS